MERVEHVLDLTEQSTHLSMKVYLQFHSAVKHPQELQFTAATILKQCCIVITTDQPTRFRQTFLHSQQVATL